MENTSKLKILFVLLVISVLAGVLISRSNTTEVISEETPESIEIKRQMLEQFMIRQGGGEAPVAEETSSTPAR